MMNLLYTVNDAYVPQLAASVTSVCESNSNSDVICFYVFSYGVSSSNQGKLKALCARYGCSVFFIDIDSFMEHLEIDFDTKGWNEIVLSRLFLARLLPNEVERILYLDADTIVRKSLSELYSYTLDHSNIIGACMEPTVDAKRLTSLGLDNCPYFNAGVLLVDISKWRDARVEQRLICCLSEKRDLLFANDQDAINVVLSGSIQALPIKYNACNTYQFYSLDFLRKISPWFSATTNEYLEARDDPTIVHYLGEERPWRIGNTHRYRKDYCSNLALTPWAEESWESGWQAYFRAWSIFNLLLGRFPSLRYAIITSLIPVFMEFRAYKNKLN